MQEKTLFEEIRNGNIEMFGILFKKYFGSMCVIAKSFARIFYRNAINVGLPVLEIGDAVKAIKAGDIVDVDLEKGTIVDKTTGDTFQARPLPGFVRDIAAAGGLINYIKGEEAHE